MYTPFQNLSDQSRIWIYQADRQLTDHEAKEILQKAKPLLETWSPHGVTLITSAEIRYNYFLILAVEATAFQLSCCTIDSAIHLLQTIEHDMKVNFLDRTKIVLQIENQFLLTPVKEIKAKLSQRLLSPNTKFFNNVITKKKDLETNWLIPIGLSCFVK
jgi:hypothetical protein